ncbi:Phage integrase family protein [Pirellula sp. SH-Sr6A]|uniref:tyrosine-type recombinase/integrase n=1 Tax=Pirellula sp. SH-Sr6A TaxID=1632865 RepID=UPI00078E18CA|nr:tyrosine-type recombinase/integrase [Pirellula sp. SH-Sr6A]AMV34548.1 Phage integrase family protein [Pirellula sp. SH-Sr6A]
MFCRDQRHQIIFRHYCGPREGRQDTLSLGRFRLSDREWSGMKRHVERILEAQRSEAPIPRSTADWLKSIPRKQFEYLQSRLLEKQSNGCEPAQLALAEWIDEYEAARQEMNTSVATDEAVLRDVRKLLRCGNDVSRIDEGCLSDLIVDLGEEHHYVENTLARHAKHWNLFFEWLRTRNPDTLGTNPCDALNRSIAPREKDTVQWEWIDQLVASCRTTEERYWLRFVQWTGCRLREGLTLRACDVELNRNRILLQESKNNRVRINPIYPAIREYLPDLLRGLGPGDRVLSRITENNCYEWLYELQDRVGVPRWKPPYNAFRATRANQLAADPTITEHQAGLLLGHSPAVARRNYLSIDDSLLERLAS